MKDDLRDWLAVQIRLASLFHQRSIEATISRSFCDQQLGERVWDWLEDLVPGLAATRLSVFSAHPFLFQRLQPPFLFLSRFLQLLCPRLQVFLLLIIAVVNAAQNLFPVSLLELLSCSPHESRLPLEQFP